MGFVSVGWLESFINTRNISVYVDNEANEQRGRSSNERWRRPAQTESFGNTRARATLPYTSLPSYVPPPNSPRARGREDAIIMLSKRNHEARFQIRDIACPPDTHVPTNLTRVHVPVHYLSAYAFVWCAYPSDLIHISVRIQHSSLLYAFPETWINFRCPVKSVS